MDGCLLPPPEILRSWGWKLSNPASLTSLEEEEEVRPVTTLGVDVLKVLAPTRGVNVV